MKVNSIEKKFNSLSEYKKDERVNFIIEKSAGIINAEKLDSWRGIVERDIDYNTRIHGLHAEHALVIISYLNNPTNTINGVIELFNNQFYASDSDRLLTLDIIKIMSDRGSQFCDEYNSLYSNRATISLKFERFITIRYKKIVL